VPRILACLTVVLIIESPWFLLFGSFFLLLGSALYSHGFPPFLSEIFIP